jgi:Tol biopolymer transport system component
MTRSRSSRRGGGLLLALVSVGALSAVATAPGTDDQAEMLLQSAIHKETVDGELEQAIDLYEKIVARYGDARTVAAQALLHMGACYEKLGRDEARKAYERLLRDYADQDEVAERARARLAALRRPPGAPSGMAARRIWSGPKADFMGEVSPDGRYLSFVDWETGDLAIRDLDKGVNRRLTDKGSWEESEEQAELSIWSPDSRQVAYWWLGDRSELRVMGLGGPESRVLWIGEEKGEELQPCDWSPDGRYILAIHGVYRQETSQKIVLLSVADRTMQVLKVLPRRVGVGRAQFSADGRSVVYDAPQADDSVAHDIFVVPVEGGPETALVEHPADDLLLGCGPEGDWVLFASDRRGTLDVWAIDFDNGRSSGPPLMVKATVGRVQPMGFTREGSFHYGVPGTSTDIYVAKLDPVTGNASTSPSKGVERYEGANRMPRYSPDGTRLAYVSKRGNEVFPSGMNWGDTLCILTLDTGEIREFHGELVRVGLRGAQSPRWSPDGKSLLLSGWGWQGVRGVYHLDLTTGAVTRLLRDDANMRIGPAEGWRDARTFVYGRRNRKRNQPQMCLRDIETGEETVIYEPPSTRNRFAVSPDGRRVCNATRLESGETVLTIMNTDGSSAHELGSRLDWNRPGFMEWSADGRHLLFVRRTGSTTDEDNTYELWRMPLDGGAPQRTGLEMPGMISFLSAHPDGQRLAFQFWAPGAQAEVWAMDNLLPPRRASN